MDKIEIIKAILSNPNTDIHPDREGNIKVKSINNSNDMELSVFIDKVSNAIDNVK